MDAAAAPVHAEDVALRHLVGIHPSEVIIVFGRTLHRTDNEHTHHGSGPHCPMCGDRQVRLGHLDRVTGRAAHTCDACGHRWSDRLIDLTREPVTIVRRG